jgi:uncharacterized membrane protein
VVRYTARDTLSLSQARTLGRVGSILVFIPFVSIVGYILILIAINDLSKSLQDRSIFKNTLIAVALEIVGWIVGLAVVLGGALTSPLTGGMSALVGLFGGLAIIWIFFIAAAFFLKRSYDTIALKLGINSFRTTGLLYLIGAGLVIVFVGFIIIFIGEIFQAISFFAIPEQPGPIGPGAPYMPPPTGPVPTTSNQPLRFCPNCGAAVDANAKFCRNCGKTLG